jgi:hypothetical protein
MMLLIDAANVVGSRPTGWWKDRAGAARAFVDQLRAAVASGRIPPHVTVVLEGRAREGVQAGLVGGVRVLHAGGTGDEAILEVVATTTEGVIVVIADRALMRAANARGADVARPGWLLELLE